MIITIFIVKEAFISYKYSWFVEYLSQKNKAVSDSIKEISFMKKIFISVIIFSAFMILTACSNIDDVVNSNLTSSSGLTDNTSVATTVTTSDKKSSFENDTYAIGNLIKFGGYEWTVLDVRDGKALLLTKDIIALKHGNISIDAESALQSIAEQTMPSWSLSDFEGYSATNTKYDGIYDAYLEHITAHPDHDDKNMWYSSWEDCSLRKWLNSEMDFTSEEWDKIDRIEVVDKTGLGANTEDKVFLLDSSEVEKYFPNNESRGASCKVSDEEMLKFLQYSLIQGTLSGDIAERGIKSLDGGIFYWWVRGSEKDDAYLKPMATDDLIKSIAPSTKKPLGIRPAIWISFE